MNKASVASLCGILLMVLAGIMLIPLGVARLYEEEIRPFSTSAIFTLTVGILLFLLFRRNGRDLGTRGPAGDLQRTRTLQPPALAPLIVYSDRTSARASRKYAAVSIPL